MQVSYVTSEGPLGKFTNVVTSGLVFVRTIKFYSEKQLHSFTSSFTLRKSFGIRSVASY